MFSIIWPTCHNWLDSIRYIITHLISNVEKIKEILSEQPITVLSTDIQTVKQKKKKRKIG